MASTLIDITYVKANFPTWSQFTTDPSGQLTQDQMLQVAIDIADAEFRGYLNVTNLTMTDQLRWMLLNLVKYQCFLFQHGDTEFKNKPQMVRDYESTVKRLEEGAVEPGSIQFEAKDRQFDEWFTDSDILWYE